MDTFHCSDDSVAVGNDFCLKSKLNLNPIVVLKRLSHNQINRYDNKFFDKHIKREESEQNNEEITDNQFMQYLGLISSKQLSEKSLVSLKQCFPVRNIGRIGEQLSDNENHIIFDKTLIIKQNFKKVVKRKTKQWIQQNSKIVSKEETNRLKQLKKKKELIKHLKEESDKRKRIISFMTNFELSSKMFNRLVRTFGFRSLNDSEVTKLLLKSIPIPDISYYRFEMSSKRTPLIKYNKWMSSDIEHKSMKSELSFSLKGNTHKYTFTRRQRLEKLKRFKCGLNWKSRLLLSNCNQLVVDLVPINICMVCGQTLDGQHSCYLKQELNPNESKPLVASFDYDDDNSNNIFESITSSDLNHLTIQSIVDTDMENQCKDCHKFNENSDNIEDKADEQKSKSMDNKKRVFNEIYANFDDNSMSKTEPIRRRRSKRLNNIQN